ncbi:MAG TPA: sigma-70 family RNA polymerase sigma factor, partial [Verrucomicrobiae bacterium]|nr:sigma-70 family RNA polymerase sigma factor [Verrucomicrobiae bacterium]
MDDRELLQDYVERHSDRAFAELVERHLPFVYATALRLVSTPAAAEDIAQCVFIDLARKAWTIRPGTLLGWLYRATQRTAYMAIRTENRRRQRETIAMNLAEQNSDSPATHDSIAPLLDGALKRLSRVEQDALLLRYFDGQSLFETGRLLSLSEAAVQKRISRALEKMRTYFAHQGINASAALLATTLGAHAAVPPPTGLAGKITSPALANAAGHAGSAGTFFLLWRILFMSTKTKIALLVVTFAVIASVAISFPLFSNAPQPAPPMAGKLQLPSEPTAQTIKNLPLPAATPAVPPPVPSAGQPQTLSENTPATMPAGDSPQLELNSALTDIVGRFRAGDFENTIMAYLPPDLSEQQLAEVREAIAVFKAKPDSEMEITTAWPKILGHLVENMSPEVTAHVSNIPRTRLSFQLYRADDLPQVDRDHPGHIYLLKDKGVWYIEEFNQGDFSID